MRAHPKIGTSAGRPLLVTWAATLWTAAGLALPTVLRWFAIDGVAVIGGLSVIGRAADTWRRGQASLDATGLIAFVVASASRRDALLTPGHETARSPPSGPGILASGVCVTGMRLVT